MDAVEDTVNREVDAFITDVNRHTAAKIPRPDVVIRADPSLIYYDDEEGAVGTLVAPKWADRPLEEQELFNQWAASIGDGTTGESFFDENFNWFLVAHELAHHLQCLSVDGFPKSLHEGEQQANDMAVAYWKSIDRPRLDKLMSQVRRVHESMDTPLSTDQEYFDANYEQLGSQPQIYGWFQFGFYLAAHDRIDDLDLATIITHDLAL